MRSAAIFLRRCVIKMCRPDNYSAMNARTHTLSRSALLSLGLGLGLGCDVAEPDSPDDRAAMLVVELDGKVIEEVDLSDDLETQQDLIAEADSAPAPTCENDLAALDLVLELDGERAASLRACVAGPAGPDDLVARPDVQAVDWTAICEATGDCFACCKCGGGTNAQCAMECS